MHVRLNRSNLMPIGTSTIDEIVWGSFLTFTYSRGPICIPLPYPRSATNPAARPRMLLPPDIVLDALNKVQESTYHPLVDTLEYHQSAMRHTEDSFDRLFGQSRIHAGCFRLIGLPVVGTSSSRHLPLALCPCKMLDDAEFCRVLWFVYQFDVVPSNLQISLFVFLFGVCAKIRELKNFGWALHPGLERMKRLVGWKKGEVWTLMSLTELKTAGLHLQGLTGPGAIVTVTHSLQLELFSLQLFSLRKRHQNQKLLSLHMGASDNWNSPTPIAESKAGHGQKDELSTQFNRSISIVRDYTNR